MILTTHILFVTLSFGHINQIGTVGTSIPTVLTVWIFLQIIEMICMYKEIRSVVFRMLNFERLCSVVDIFLSSYESHLSQDSVNGDILPIQQLVAADIPTPEYMSDIEKIFLPPAHLSRRAIAFGSLSRAKLSPEELRQLLQIFHSEKFILVVGEDVKNKRHRLWNRIRRWNKVIPVSFPGHDVIAFAKENCHIVLHSEATNADIVKGVLSLFILRRKLADNLPIVSKGTSSVTRMSLERAVRSRRSCDCMDLILNSKMEADTLFPILLSVIELRGWAQPAKFMFGRVTMRAQWPLP